MQIDVGYFYFIKDSFFDIMDDPELMKNKESGNKRPCYYCIKSKKYDNIIWFISVSTKQGEKKMSDNYFSNMGDISEYGISLMKFFHPDGYKYCDEMNGICNIFLVNEPADILLNRKKEIRKEYASLYEGKTVKWFNGKKIKWTYLGMNMVHSSDNSCEACCNFRSIFPESQLMTRFMYPNPKLIF